MEVIRCKKKLFVPIFGSDGAAYSGDIVGNNAILIYAKKRTTENTGAGIVFPYDWWDDDIAVVTGNALVGGTIVLASLEYIGDGMWTMEMDTNSLDNENPDREDYYFVKTGTISSYGGAGDTNWTLVEGYDPVGFGTYIIPPKSIKRILTYLSSFEAIDWSDVVDILALAEDISLNTNHRDSPGASHSLFESITLEAILNGMATNDNILEAMAAILSINTTLAANIASISE